jgi:hypothetical protein
MSLNLGALVQLAMQAVPSSLRKDITLVLQTPVVADEASSALAAPTITDVLGVATQGKLSPVKLQNLRLTESDVQALLFVPSAVSGINEVTGATSYFGAEYFGQFFGPYFGDTSGNNSSSEAAFSSSTINLMHAAVLWGGKRYTVRNVEPIAPDGSALAFTLVIAR